MRSKAPSSTATVLPPYYAVQVDGQTGEVLRSGAIKAQDMGIRVPLQTMPGVGRKPGVSRQESATLRNRLEARSPEVWKAYEEHVARDPRGTSVDVALVSQYLDDILAYGSPEARSSKPLRISSSGSALLQDADD